MAKKPSYIGLLNALANGERGGHELFASWSVATQDKALKKTLDMVAVREMEHSWAFEKRLSELGFELRAPADASGKAALVKHVALLSSDVSDEKKFASFGIGGSIPKGKKLKKNGKKSSKESKKLAKRLAKEEAAQAEPDKLLMILSDPSIDPATGALMGRFIAEERDTGRRLAKAYKALQQRQRS